MISADDIILCAMNSPELLLPTDYVAKATELVRHAKKRVYIISLSLTRGSATNEFIDEILLAAQRGVDVHVAIDLLTFICDRTSRLPSRVMGRDMIQTNQLRREFKQAGAKFRWLGMQRVPYLVGRTHSKWTIIDDDVFSFGGVNLNQSGVLDRTDYILHLNDRRIADRLTAEQDLIERVDPNKRRINDHCIKTDYGDMLLDSGLFGHSVIYNRAVRLARQASEIVVVTQYCPSGKLSKILHKHNARVYFNPKGSAADIANNFMIGSKRTIAEQPNSYTRNRYLHAKFIIATMPDGSKHALTGSHNFTAIGVHTGTREIALDTTDPTVIQQLEDFLNKYVA